MAEVETVTSDLDIYRSAKILIDQHGDEVATLNLVMGA